MSNIPNLLYIWFHEQPNLVDIDEDLRKQLPLKKLRVNFGFRIFFKKGAIFEFFRTNIVNHNKVTYQFYIIKWGFRLRGKNFFLHFFI